MWQCGHPRKCNVVLLRHRCVIGVPSTAVPKRRSRGDDEGSKPAQGDLEVSTTRKHALLELPVDDILLLVQVLPGLGDVVARECKLSVATLKSGGRRASQSLQTQLTRRP